MFTGSGSFSAQDHFSGKMRSLTSFSPRFFRDATLPPSVCIVIFAQRLMKIRRAINNTRTPFGSEIQRRKNEKHPEFPSAEDGFASDYYNFDALCAH